MPSQHDSQCPHSPSFRGVTGLVRGDERVETDWIEATVDMRIKFQCHAVGPRWFGATPLATRGSSRVITGGHVGEPCGSALQ